jgi:hypothetical protein
MCKDPKKVKAGLTLAASVSRDYYRFIGRRGGRATEYNSLVRLAQTFDCRQAGWGQSGTAAQVDRWNAEMRQHYLEVAQKYRDYNGTRIMLELFDRQHDIKKKRKRCK